MTKKILIAEDDKTLAKALKQKVADAGFEVIEATDGEQALQKFISEKPDLVLLDIVMPSKSGMEVLEEIRIKMSNKTPIIILSNLEGEKDIETAKNLGVVDYFIKSNISLLKLVTKIHEVLSV